MLTELNRTSRFSFAGTSPTCSLFQLYKRAAPPLISQECIHPWCPFKTTFCLGLFVLFAGPLLGLLEKVINSIDPQGFSFKGLSAVSRAKNLCRA